MNLKRLFTILAVVAWAGSPIVAQDVGKDIPSNADGDTSGVVSLNQINNIARQIISPCCWKQTVDVHPSETSDKIKRAIEAALKDGQTEEEIINRFVAEYGERILAIPKASGFNWMLWILPAVILIAGSFVLIMILRRISHFRAEANTSDQPAMDEADVKRVERELEKLDA